MRFMNRSWPLAYILNFAVVFLSYGAVAQTEALSRPIQSSVFNRLNVSAMEGYEANAKPAEFSVGSQPYGIAFDGQNLWTANFAEGTVSKLRATDGKVLNTVAVGRAPVGIVFDGNNIWVTNGGDGTVSKVRTRDGKVLGTFSVGRQPWWPALDGENVWVPNYLDGTVTKLRASDGKNLGSFATGTGGAIAAAFDGSCVWVATYANRVVKLKEDGSIAGTYTVGHQPLGIVFGGAYIWVANQGGSSISKLRVSDGAIVGTFNVPLGPYELAFDGVHLWVTGEIEVVELRVADGVVVGKYPIGGTTGIALDGENVWVAVTGLSKLLRMQVK
jgi:DNA-binding beta-propeller fold protein YncE